MSVRSIRSARATATMSPDIDARIGEDDMDRHGGSLIPLLIVGTVMVLGLFGYLGG
ncbi:MAG TPA: hypothetical protein VMU33_11140 [Burkholderiaceae bacterium]|nr:hypothetical protein [Burkholderiaceae bacterium]